MSDSKFALALSNLMRGEDWQNTLRSFTLCTRKTVEPVRQQEFGFLVFRSYRK